MNTDTSSQAVRLSPSFITFTEYMYVLFESLKRCDEHWGSKGSYRKGVKNFPLIEAMDKGTIGLKLCFAVPVKFHVCLPVSWR